MAIQVIRGNGYHIFGNHPMIERKKIPKKTWENISASLFESVACVYLKQRNTSAIVFINEDLIFII